MHLDSLLHDTIPFLRGLVTGFSQDNKGYRNFSSTFIGTSDDTYVLNEGVREEMTLEFCRADLEALCIPVISNLGY